MTLEETIDALGEHLTLRAYQSAMDLVQSTPDLKYSQGATIIEALCSLYGERCHMSIPTAVVADAASSLAVHLFRMSQGLV